MKRCSEVKEGAQYALMSSPIAEPKESSHFFGFSIPSYNKGNERLGGDWKVQTEQENVCATHASPQSLLAS